MSLDDTPEPTLRELKGRLETIQTEWALATTPAARAGINEEFKRLAESIRQKFGAEGKRVVDEVVAKNMALRRPRS